MPGPADLEDDEDGGEDDRQPPGSVACCGGSRRRRGSRRTGGRRSDAATRARPSRRRGRPGTPPPGRRPRRAPSARVSPRDADEADEREREHQRERRPAPGAEVAGRLPEVRDDRPRAAELRAAAADTDVEPSREHEIGEPERRAERRRRRRSEISRAPEPVAPCDAARTLPARRARARRRGATRRRAGSRSSPGRPGQPPAAVERPEQEHEREQREEQEQAVHPGVDAVEEEDPAAGDERGRDQRRRCGPASRRPRSAIKREAARRRRRRRRAAARRARSPRWATAKANEEVERCAAALAGHVLDHTGEAVAADEERERLVLVRRPRHQLVERGMPLPSTAIAPTPIQSSWAATNARTEAQERAGQRRGFCALRHRSSAASSLVDWPPDADLRVPLPERAHVRALPEDERCARPRAARSAGRARSRRSCSRWRCTTRAPASTRPTTAVDRARAAKDGEGGGSGEKRRLGRQEGAHEGHRLRRQESRCRGLTAAHSLRSPITHPGA